MSGIDHIQLTGRHLQPGGIDWASLGQSEFDLPGTWVSDSQRRPDTQLVINLDTLGRSEIAMPGDDADMEMSAMTESAIRRAKGDSGAENGPDQSRAQIQAHGVGGGTSNILLGARHPIAPSDGMGRKSELACHTYAR